MLAGHVVRHPEARRGFQCRPRVGRFRNAVAGQEQAVEGVPRVGDQRPDRERRVRPEQLSGEGIQRLAVGARARLRSAAGDVQHRSLARVPLLGKEVRGLSEHVVLRLLMNQADAVVERQLVVHLPVVLDVAFSVVVDELPLDIPRELVVRREHPERGVGEAEARVERVAGVVREVHRARPALALLRLVAVRVVEAGLDRVPADQLRQADGDVVGRIDVEIAGERHVGRRIRDAAAPREAGGHPEPRAVPDRRIDGVECLVRVVGGVDDARVAKKRRQTAEAGGVEIGDVVHRQRALAARRPRARLRQGASGQLVLRVAVRAFEERRCVHVVVHRRRDDGDHGLELACVVEARNRAGDRRVLLLPAAVLERPPKPRRRLVVDAHGGLPRDQLLRRPSGFVIVRGARHVDVRQRVHLQDVEAGLIHAIGGNPAERAARLEARRLAGGRARSDQERIFDVGKQVAVVVRGLRKVALTLERRWQPVAHRLAAARARRVFVTVEEEQLVVAARPADRAADRVAQILFVQLRLRVAVEERGAADRIPLRAAKDVVRRSPEAVRAALGDGADLDAARAAVLRLVVRDEHLDFRDRLDVHLEEDTVVAGVHRGHSVHHDVVVAAARGRAVADAARPAHAGRQRRQRREAAVANRQVFDRLRRDRERPLAALRLNERRFGRHQHRLGQAADFDRERAQTHAVAGADADAAAPEGLEALHDDLQRVGVRRHVGEHEIAVGVGDRIRETGSAPFADQRDRRAGDDAGVRVLDRAGDRARRQLPRGGRREREHGQRHRGDDRESVFLRHSYLPVRTRRRTCVASLSSPW